ncbi:hypothetical protein BC939DRAFT_250219 [Gamsiella multidivaricata]|uniref:uncharacterized protein n=1 Tax=Gamsiella multidivaricata TaxID=101098 RepID=UPI00221F066C|nr:uncharacterized protein BC939DRAFT_250219 [Gamsiella multidivaricata]KAI7819676.1 hypothetical protein BC939DRAFT_250219 [Gamsiella multidivaricata]
MKSRNCIIELSSDGPASGSDSAVHRHDSTSTGARKSTTGPSQAVRSPLGAAAIASASENIEYKGSSDRNTTVPDVVPAVWYFEEAANALYFNCTTEPPVKASITKQDISWTTDISQLKQRLYRPVVGISLKDIDLNSLESIIFYVGVDSPTYLNASCAYWEIITKRQLKVLSRSSKGLCRWKLHRQFDNSGLDAVRPLIVKIMVCLSPHISPASVRGFLELHYFELHSCSVENYIHDIPMRAHEPYLWSIDIEHMETPTEPSPAQSVEIVHYSISGDGTHAATLSATDRCLYLDLWDLSCASKDALGMTDTDKRGQKSSSSPEWSAGKSLPFSRSRAAQSELAIAVPKSIKATPVIRTDKEPILVNATVSVSWNATYVVLLPTARGSQAERLAIYKYSAPHGPDTSKSRLNTPTAFTELECCESLRDFYGEGSFHITDIENPQEKNELFITCDGTSVRLYKVYGTWSYIRKVSLGVDSPLSSGDLIHSLQGKYLSWFRKGLLLIWNIEASTMASVVTGITGTEHLSTFSSDGSMIAVSHGRTITTYWTGSGTAIGTYKLPLNTLKLSSETCALSLTFVRHDSQILVDRLSYRDGYQGYILDAATMSLVGKFISPGRYIRSEARSQGLFSCHGSTLNLVRLEDYIFDPLDPTTCRCDQQSGDDFAFISDERTFTPSSGLTFSFKFLPAAEEDVDGVHTFSLKVSEHGLERELLRVPPIALTDLPYQCAYIDAFFFEDLSQLLLYADEFVMMWGLPETFDGDCTLLQTHWTQDKPFRLGNYHPLSLYERNGIVSCKHQKQLLYNMYHLNDDDDDELVVVELPLNRPADGDQGFKFVNGIMVLVEMYKVAADVKVRQAIIRYLELHLNRYPNPENLLDCVIGKIIDAWKPRDSKVCEELMALLLASSSVQWIPRLDYDRHTNPIWTLLDKSSEDPLAMGLAIIIIRYCLQKAKEEEDIQFISPLTACLPELFDQNLPHLEIALNSLHKMAYIPVKQRSFVIDNHRIAHPPEIRWPFWKRDERPLHTWNNPILQLELSPKPHKTQKDNFTKGVFVASFEMLWRVENFANGRESQIFENSSWVHTLLLMIWHTCAPKSRTYVTSHAFILSAFDNPAIEALIEYKWNMFGFKYWLIRFLLQCVYYLLVLTAVFLQVYQNQEPILPIFAIIIILSVIFLWLEFVQFLHNPSRYFLYDHNEAICSLFVFLESLKLTS